MIAHVPESDPGGQNVDGEVADGRGGDQGERRRGEATHPAGHEPHARTAAGERSHSYGAGFVDGGRAAWVGGVRDQSGTVRNTPPPPMRPLMPATSLTRQTARAVPAASRVVFRGARSQADVVAGRPSKTAARMLVAAVAGAGTVGGLGALTWAEMVMAKRAPGLPEIAHELNGAVGGGEQTLIWLGDSLAAGVGADSSEETLPRAVARRLPGGAHLRVHAISGATAGDVIDEQLDSAVADLVEHPGATVVLSVGANDISHLTSRRRYRDNMDALIGALENAGAGSIVTVSIPQVASALRLAQPLRSIAAARGWWLDLVLRRFAAEGRTTYASVRTPPIKVPRRELATYLSADRYHPSGVGYAVWADLILSTLTPAHAVV